MAVPASLKERTVNALDKDAFSLGDIPRATVEAFFSSQCSDADLENVKSVTNVTKDVLEPVASVLAEWAAGASNRSHSNSAQAQAANNLWSCLAENNLSFRGLVVVLYAHMDTADPLLALAAARTYLTLVSVPGNVSVLSPVALRASLNILKCWAKACAKRSRAESKSQDLFAPSAQAVSLEKAWRAPEALDGVVSLLRACIAMASVSLTAHRESLSHAIEALVEVTRCYGAEISTKTPSSAAICEDGPADMDVETDETVTTGTRKSNRSATVQNTAVSLAQATKSKNTALTASQSTTTCGSDHPATLAFQALRALLTPVHGPLKETFRLLLKHLLPNILLTFHGLVGSTVPKKFKQLQKASLDFVAEVGSACLSEAQAKEPVLILIQHICVRTPDRTQYRDLAAQAIKRLVHAFPSTCQGVAKFLAKFSRNSKAGARVLSLEVCFSLLELEEVYRQQEYKHAEPEAEGSAQPVTQACAVVAQTLLTVLLARCNDKAPTVRAKALSLLSGAVNLAGNMGHGGLRFNFQRVIEASTPHKGSPDAESSPVPSTPCLNRDDSFVLLTPSALQQRLNGADSGTGGTLSRNVSLAGSIPVTPVSPFHPQNTGAAHVFSVLRRRSTDERPVVRKAAVMALHSMLMASDCDAGNFNPADLQVLYDGCMDAASSLRKQSLVSLTALLAKYRSDAVLQRVWLGAVLPMVHDRTSGVQEQCLKAVNTVILEPMCTSTRAETKGTKGTEVTEHVAADPVWRLLEVADSDSLRYLQAGLTVMLTQKKVPIPTTLCSQMNKVLGVSTHKGVWLVAEEIAKHAPKSVDVSGVVHAWSALDQTPQSTTEHEGQHTRVLRTLGHLCECLSLPEAGHAANALYTALSQFHCHPTLIQAQVFALRKACSALESQQRQVHGQERIPLPPWETELLAACLAGLKHFVLNAATMPMTPDLEASVVRRLYTLGEVCLHMSGQPSTEAVTLVQSLMPPTLSALTSGSATAGTPIQPSDAPGALVLSDRIRGHAFIALGKLCMRDGALARKSITLLVRELESGSSAVIRNNVLVVLCDLCRTFTSVVDNYLGHISSCLTDSNSMIRRHTVMIISQLLQEDYLKWKGAMFFRLLTSVADTDHRVSSFARHSLTNMLTSKWPKLASRHFVELMFYCNGVYAHTKYLHFARARDTETEAKEVGGYHQHDRDQEHRFMANFRGAENKRQRLKLYRFLISFMSEADKFNAAASLVKEILGGLVEGCLSLECDGSACGTQLNPCSCTRDLVSDALVLLSSSDLRLKSMRKGLPDADDEEDAVAVRGRAMDAAKGKLLSTLAKKNTLENVVPVLVELKRLLEKQKSSLLKLLMRYLQELLSDYKGELEDLLAADRQLASELEYDLRNFRRQQTSSREDEELVRLSTTPGTVGSPSGKFAHHAAAAARVGNVAGISRRLSMSSAILSAGGVGLTPSSNKRRTRLPVRSFSSPTVNNKSATPNRQQRGRPIAFNTPRLKRASAATLPGPSPQQARSTPVSSLDAMPPQAMARPHTPPTPPDTAELATRNTEMGDVTPSKQDSNALGLKRSQSNVMRGGGADVILPSPVQQPSNSSQPQKWNVDLTPSRAKGQTSKRKRPPSPGSPVEPENDPHVPTTQERPHVPSAEPTTEVTKSPRRSRRKLLR